MTQTFLKGSIPSVHRIDIQCEQTGFSIPPCDVHIKFLPAAVGGGWTLLAHAAAGKADILARWLQPHPGLLEVRAAPGIAPKLLRAKAAVLPKEWATMGSFVKIHHLDLAPDGSASWFVEGVRESILAMVRQLEAAPSAPRLAHEVRCRPVQQGGPGETGTGPPLSRRQFETLSSAVALGYYEIPHRLDLRALGLRTGISLGAVSELLRRAEGAVLTHYVDSSLMHWPALAGVESRDVLRPLDNFRPMDNLLRPVSLPFLLPSPPSEDGGLRSPPHARP